MSKAKPNVKIPPKIITREQKKEPSYWLIKTYVYLLMTINAIAILLAVSGLVMFKKDHAIPADYLLISIVISGLYIAFLWGITQWKKWGFWGYCVTSIFSIIVSIGFGMPIHKSLAIGILSILILYGVLQIGGKKKAWKRLA